MLIGAALGLGALVLPHTLGMRALVVAVILALYAWAGWTLILSPAERDFAVRFFTERWRKAPVPPDQPVAS